MKTYKYRQVVKENVGINNPVFSHAKFFIDFFFFDQIVIRVSDEHRADNADLVGDVPAGAVLRFQLQLELSTQQEGDISFFKRTSKAATLS